MDLKSPQFWRKINSIDLPLVVTVISATGSRYVLPKMTEHAQSFTCKGSTWTLPRGPAASAIKKHSLSTGPLPPKESTNCPLDVSCRSITWTVLFRSQRVEVDSFPVGYGSMNVVDIFSKIGMAVLHFREVTFKVLKQISQWWTPPRTYGPV